MADGCLSSSTDKDLLTTAMDMGFSRSHAVESLSRWKGNTSEDHQSVVDSFVSFLLNSPAEQSGCHAKGSGEVGGHNDSHGDDVHDDDHVEDDFDDDDEEEEEEDDDDDDVHDGFDFAADLEAKPDKENGYFSRKNEFLVPDESFLSRCKLGIETRRRLIRELKSLTTEMPPGFRFTSDGSSTPFLDVWYLEFDGPKDSLYEKEQFKLRFQFNADYPFQSPRVQFVSDPPRFAIPVHPHIWSNGYLCLSILYKDWRPSMDARSLCLSIQSFVASATEKRPPIDDGHMKNVDAYQVCYSWSDDAFSNRDA